ncbi:MAG: hypothetical protein H6699_01030 [Myxococcales bacterium]|nr:hypothetical protein [Myxococcales bacterium]
MVVEYDGALPSVAPGRQLAPQFVVEAWPVSSDCAVPTSEGPTDALARHLRAGFDTMYEYWGGGPPRCPTPTPTAVNELLPAASYDLGVLVGDDFPYAADDAGGLIRDTSRVAAFDRRRVRRSARTPTTGLRTPSTMPRARGGSGPSTQR